MTIIHHFVCDFNSLHMQEYSSYHIDSNDMISWTIDSSVFSYKDVTCFTLWHWSVVSLSERENKRDRLMSLSKKESEKESIPESDTMLSIVYFVFLVSCSGKIHQLRHSWKYHKTSFKIQFMWIKIMIWSFSFNGKP